MAYYKFTLVFLCVLHPLLAQNIDDYSRNFCQENLGVDNFSCEESRVGGVSCFNREELCNNSTLCVSGEDEESVDIFVGLQCKH